MTQTQILNAKYLLGVVYRQGHRLYPNIETFKKEFKIQTKKGLKLQNLTFREPIKQMVEYMKLNNLTPEDIYNNHFE